MNNVCALDAWWDSGDLWLWWLVVRHRDCADVDGWVALLFKKVTSVATLCCVHFPRIGKTGGAPSRTGHLPNWVVPF
jgi:hypothetical protein